MVVDFERRNFGLDVMRAIAISLVFVIHLLFNFFPSDWWVLWYLAYLGVDVFFVLSGFLIGHLLLQAIEQENGRFGFLALKRFLFRRWMRTVPLYYTLLLLNFVAGYFLLNTAQTFDWRFLIWSQNLTHPPPVFFGESWSLCVEEWFYVLFPCGLCFFLKFGNPKKPGIIPLYTLLFIIAASTVRCVETKEKFQEFNIALLRLDAIAYGVFFAVLERRYFRTMPKKKSVFWALSGLFLLVTGISIFLKGQAKLSLLYYPFSGLGLGCILLFLRQMPGSGVPPFVYRCVRFFSKISYSIYLNNLIIIFLTRRYLTAQAAWQMAAAAIATVGFSYLTFRYIEMHFIKMRDRLVPAIRTAKKKK